VAFCKSCLTKIESGSLCDACAGEAARDISGAGRVVISRDCSALLENLLTGPSPLHPMVRSAIKAKLDSALAVYSADLPRDVVSLNSRVHYQIEDNPPQTRTLVARPGSSIPGHTLLLTTPAGISMLGLPERGSVYLPTAGGPPRRLKVLSILHQPESAHDRFFSARFPVGERTAPTMRNLPPEPRIPTFRGDDDNPGPYAA
jgi:regulator of nucleoside diphosphate kinase